jgi:predicted lipid-binding transport protein (Tim44 family)
VATNDENPLPPGRQPYDSLTGLRVGAVAGGLLGGLGGAVMRTPWLLLAGAGIGAAVGYLTERRTVRNETQKLHGDGPGSGSTTDDPA